MTIDEYKAMTTANLAVMGSIGAIICLLMVMFHQIDSAAHNAEGRLMTNELRLELIEKQLNELEKPDDQKSPPP